MADTERVLAAIREVPELDALTALVETHWENGELPIEAQVDLFAALVDAEGVALETLLSGQGELSPRRVPRNLKDVATTFFPVDSHYTDLKRDGEAILPRLRFGSPVDWFVRLVKLDASGLPGKLSELKAEEAYKRTTYQQTSVIRATRITDFPPQITSAASGGIRVGGALPLDPDDPNAVYVLRAFSGALWDRSPGDIDSLTLDKIPLGTTDQVLAFSTNLAQTAVEIFMLSFTPPGGLKTIGVTVFNLLEDAVAELIPFLETQVRIFLTRAGQIIDTSATIEEDLLELTYELTTEAFFELGRIVVRLGENAAAGLSKNLPFFGTVDAFVSLAGPRSSGKITSAIADALARGTVSEANKEALQSKLNGAVKKRREQFNKVFKNLINIPRLAERLLGMIGVQPLAFAVDTGILTPLESHFIVVGFPFGLIIEEVEPRDLRPGESMRIQGAGFGDEQARVRVTIGGRDAEVVSLSAENERGLRTVEVKMPEGVRRGVDLSVVVQSGDTSGTAEQTVRVPSLPVIRTLDPPTGYFSADLATRTGRTRASSSTRIVLRGEGFRAEQKVYFRGADGLVEAPIRNPLVANARSNTLEVDVPRGARSGTLVIEDGGMQVESEQPFTILPPPRIQSVTPQEARAGTPIVVEMENLPADPRDTSIFFDDGTTRRAAFETFLDAAGSRVRVLMPSSESDFQNLVVHTPTGSVTQRITAQPGRSRGIDRTVAPTPGLTPAEQVEKMPDGKLSFVELFEIVQGKLDPFATPYDDQSYDAEVTITADRNNLTYTIDAITPRSPRGGPGTESIFAKETLITIRDGEVVSRNTTDVVHSMDSTDRSLWGGKAVTAAPGYGAIEEGDFFNSDRVGAAFEDSIVVPDIGGLDLVLDGADAGGDTLTFNGESRFGNLIVVNTPGNTLRTIQKLATDAELVVNGDENLITGGGFDSRMSFGRGLRVTGHGNTFSSIEGKAVIEGNRNEFTLMRFEGNYEEGPGLAIAGNDNVLSGVELRNVAVGLKLEGGSNRITAFESIGCPSGVVISGAKALGNHLQGGIFSGDEARLRHGVIVEAGAKSTLLQLEIRGCTEDAIVVKGEATEDVLIRDAVLEKNDQVGVSVSGGARGTVVQDSRIHQCGTSGFAISGRGSDFTTIENVHFRNNGAPDIVAIGSGDVGPNRILIDSCEFLDTAGTAIRIEGIGHKSVDETNVRMTRNRIHQQQSAENLPTAAAIEIVNSRSIESDSNSIAWTAPGFASAFLVSGSTDFESTGDATGFLHETAYRFTGASGNLAVTNASIGRNLRPTNDPKIGFAIEDGTTGVEIRSDADQAVNHHGRNRWLTEIQATESHIVIGEFASDVLLSGIRTRNVPEKKGLLIDGGSHVRTEGCSFHTASILNGASHISIGLETLSDASVLKNTFFVSGFDPLPEPAIEVLGEHTSDIGIFRTDIRGYSTGILVREAVNVTIGSPASGGSFDGPWSNVFGGNVTNLDLDRARDVRVQNNRIEGRAGIGVANGSDVVIGGVREEVLEEDGPGTGNVFEGDQREAAICVRGPDNFGIVIGNNRITRYLPTGIHVKDGGSNTLIAYNTIVANPQDGILFEGAGPNNEVVSNALVDNRRAGVHVIGGEPVPILGNRIHNNRTAGILLGEGGNGEIERPVFDTFFEANQRISGRAPGAPIGSRIEFFGDRNRQGEVLIGATTVANAGGEFSAHLETTLAPGLDLTATVTHVDGGTSAFGYSVEPLSPNRRPAGSYVFSSTRDNNREIYRLLPGDAAPVRLTEEAALDEQPALSRDDEWIAFTSDRSGNQDLWLMRSDGSDTQQLTDHPGTDRDPAWHSRTSQRRLAFISDRDGNPEIFIYNVDLAWPDQPRIEQLTHTDPGTSHSDPSWSPFSDQLICVRSAPDGTARLIRLATFSPENVEVLTEDFSGQVSQPAWGPDFVSIAFTGNVDGENAIYILFLDQIRKLTAAGSPARHPAWIRRGVLGYSGGPLNEERLYTIDADGENKRALSPSIGRNLDIHGGF
ncbi:MAG: right-handed parallel beta-helix repeat-containing protein [Verrucomicrobiota bacterium]